MFELEKGRGYWKGLAKEKDQCIAGLVRVVKEMEEQRMVYVPEGDEIDLRLADFINGSEDPGKLSKLFIREGEGVYSFGSKKIYVKMESGKIFIRVGGGFLT